MEKVSMQIVDIEEEENPNGLTMLRITVKSKGKIYIFAAKKEDYMDEKVQKRIDQSYLRTIKKAQEQSIVEKSEKKQSTKKLMDIIGNEVEEVVY